MRNGSLPNQAAVEKQPDWETDAGVAIAGSE